MKLCLSENSENWSPPAPSPSRWKSVALLLPTPACWCCFPVRVSLLLTAESMPEETELVGFGEFFILLERALFTEADAPPPKA